MTQKIFDDTITVLKVTVNATRPTDIYVADTLDLGGGEVSANFDARIEDELIRITAVSLDDPVAGTDKWTISHLGGAAASGHDAGVEIEVILSASGVVQFINDTVSGNYAALAGATFTGDVELEAQLVDDTEASGSDGQILTKVSGHPRWATDTTHALLSGATFTGDVELEGQLVDATEASGSDGQVLTKVSGNPQWAAGGVPASGGTFTGNVEFEADIIDDTEAAGSDGDVLTKVSGHPRWAAQAGGGDVSHTGATFTGDVEFEADIIDDTESAGTDGQVLTKVSSHPRWAAAAGGGGGGLLARLAYNPNPGTDYTTTSTTWAAADGTNLSLAFTAPVSGNVIITLSAEAWGVNNEVTLGWGVGPHSGSVTSTTEAGITSNGSSTSRTRSTLSCYITGLTFGSSYTYDWFMNASYAGFTVGFGAGVRTNEGPSPAIMEVWSA